jgi:hypothetical protein
LYTDCEAKQFWILSRHGTRYADADEVDDLRDLYDLQKKIVNNHEEDGSEYRKNMQRELLILIKKKA